MNTVVPFDVSVNDVNYLTRGRRGKSDFAKTAFSHLLLWIQIHAIEHIIIYLSEGESACSVAPHGRIKKICYTRLLKKILLNTTTQWRGLSAAFGRDAYLEI